MIPFGPRERLDLASVVDVVSTPNIATVDESLSTQAAVPRLDLARGKAWHREPRDVRHGQMVRVS